MNDNRDSVSRDIRSRDITVEGDMTVEHDIRELIAAAANAPAAHILCLPADTPLFAPEIGLTSLTGVALLNAVNAKFGVDVATLDINLDALASIGSLAEFVTEHQ